MKTILYKAVALFLFVTGLAACDSMVSDVDVPAADPKLVVNSYISPGLDSVHVRLNYSRPLYTISSYYDYSYSPVTDAIVTISDGNEAVTLTYNAFDRQYFTTGLVISAGKTYYLEVTTPRQERVTSQCTVPVTDIPQPEITSPESNPDYPYERSFGFQFKDPSGEGNFYRVAVGHYYQYGELPEYSFFETIYMQTGEEFVSDINKDGEIFIYKTGWIPIIQQVGNSVSLLISVTDEHYFNYHRSINNFQDDNPFSEPTPVYSNIEGGLGVFAAYKSQITEVALNGEANP